MVAMLQNVMGPILDPLEEALGLSCPLAGAAAGVGGESELLAAVELLRLHAEIYMQGWSFFILIMIGVAGMLGVRPSGAPRIGYAGKVFLTLSLMLYYVFFYFVQMDNGCDILRVQDAVIALAPENSALSNVLPTFFRPREDVYFAFIFLFIVVIFLWWPRRLRATGDAQP